jgi:hypothetical protein
MLTAIGARALSSIGEFLYHIRQITELKTSPKFPAIRYLSDNPLPYLMEVGTDVQTDKNHQTIAVTTYALRRGLIINWCMIFEISKRRDA